MHAPLSLPLIAMVQVASALPKAGRGCSSGNNANANGKAIYMITNERNNAVVAVPIGQDGLLGNGGSSTATGGAGANGIDGALNQPAAPDPLFSQSSLTIAGNVRHRQARLRYLDCMLTCL